MSVEGAAAIDDKLRVARPNGRDAGRPLEVLHFADMLSPNLSTRSLVKGFIDAEAIALIYGESGCGKTFLTLDLALHVAEGREWMGRRVSQGRVVYVAIEAGRSIANRVAAYAKERSPAATMIDFRAVVSPVDLCHLKNGDLDRLIGAIHVADLVVIDTVSRALAGGNENAPDDMGAFVKALDQLRERLRCAVIAVHHVGKDASRGGRGHSLLHCAVDTEIEVERVDEERGVSIATVTKQRDGPGGGEVAFWLKQVELGLDQDSDPVTSCVVELSGYVPEPKLKPLTGDAKVALDVLNEAIRATGEDLSGNETEVELPDGTTTTFEQAGVRAVKVEVWRERLAKSDRFSQAGTDAFRKKWSRALKKLDENGHILQRGGYVWATRTVPF